MDDLLKRADKAIEDGHRVRHEARERRMQARMTAAQLRGTLKWVRAEGARSRFRQLGLETADKQAAFHENRADR